MTLKQIKIQFQQELAFLYPKEESLSILQILCEDLLHWSRTDFMIRDQDAFNHLEQEVLERALVQLKTAKPVQYITGIAHFYGHMFQVTPATLIPRQETEELVHLILQDYKATSYLNIIDLGTGSGCIGLSLKLAKPDASITLLDYSQEALTVATANSIRLKAPVKTLQRDLLQVKELPDTYDVIVSNPPYVRELEKAEIHKNVLQYEPHQALFVKDQDPLIFYRRILKLAQKALRPEGVLYFEINQYLSNEMKALALAMGFDSEIKKDLNNNFRMMKCWQNKK